MHPKTADGVDSLEASVVDAAVAAVRHVTPGLPLGVTTGFWALPDVGPGCGLSANGVNCPTSPR